MVTTRVRCIGVFPCIENVFSRLLEGERSVDRITTARHACFECAIVRLHLLPLICNQRLLLACHLLLLLLLLRLCLLLSALAGRRVHNGIHLSG